MIMKKKFIEFHRFVISVRGEKINFEFNKNANTKNGVPLTFDLPSNQTVGSKDMKSIVIKKGCEKIHYTVVIIC